MKSNPVIAIVGATGLVGNEMLVCLEESDIEFRDLRLFASDDSEGEVYSCRDSEYRVERIDNDSFEGVDLALFAVRPELIEKIAPAALEAGAVIIDYSMHYRGRDEIPMIVPEVNFDLVKKEDRIISCPDALATMLLPVLNVINMKAGIKRVVVSTYHAVSSAGKTALDELWSQTLAVFNQRDIENEAFQHQIAFNCIPQIDILRNDGYTKEETAIVSDTRRVLGMPSLNMTVTAVRVPVFHSHAATVNIELEKSLSAEDCLSLLKDTNGVEVDPVEYPMQLTVTGSDTIHVGRIRKDPSLENGLDLWVVADNLRKGSALNVIQIARKLVEKFGE